MIFTGTAERRAATMAAVEATAPGSMAAMAQTSKGDQIWVPEEVREEAEDLGDED